MLALVAGCGGGGGGGGGEGTTTQAEGQRVVGPGFTFRAPTSWEVSHEARSATVKPGGDEPTLASVTGLTLRSKYAPRLYARVSKELDAVTSSLADKLNGKVIARRDIVASGIRSRQYDLAYERDGEGLVDRITFVLKGTDEYYVLCRWLADRGEPEACGLLLRTFATR
ncbi:MAG TPA: hypothetical protein VLK53_12910 [Gaiellaceae bacterium]|jgi:hypothetical protein|nr:hypothetical protein [Gaiellaceae bacterium]